MSLLPACTFTKEEKRERDNMIHSFLRGARKFLLENKLERIEKNEKFRRNCTTSAQNNLKK